MLPVSPGCSHVVAIFVATLVIEAQRRRRPRRHALETGRQDACPVFPPTRHFQSVHAESSHFPIKMHKFSLRFPASAEKWSIKPLLTP